MLSLIRLRTRGGDIVSMFNSEILCNVGGGVFRVPVLALDFDLAAVGLPVCLPVSRCLGSSVCRVSVDEDECAVHTRCVGGCGSGYGVCLVSSSCST